MFISFGQHWSKRILANDINYHLERVVLCGAIVSNFLEAHSSSAKFLISLLVWFTNAIEFSVHFAILSLFFLRRKIMIFLPFLYFEGQKLKVLDLNFQY